ncbi:MAG TPA: HNH endonuclease signature motif containing protein, partial [Kofleriaceae bacterium]|nr:HNH endonuclease signature motif containing protein [Kofleriaceae bacterium]
LSEAEAYHRITVSRAARRFPSILPMLASGQLHISAVARVAAHLTDDAAEPLLARVAGRSRREIDALVAELAPKPDVPDSIRPLGHRRPQSLAVPPSPARELCLDGVAAAAEPTDVARTLVPPSSPPPEPQTARPPEPSAPPPAPPPAPEPPPPRLSPVSPPAVVVPISPGRFKVQFTASSELEAKISRARALLRHRIPGGDLSAVIDLAVTVLLADLERKKCGVTPAPRRSLAETDFDPVSRHIPAASRRAIWQRDEGRCTFVDHQGRRCPAREKLEFHHEVPFARGGDHSPDNVRLLCRTHNAFRAELDYGRELILQKVEARRSTARRSVQRTPRPEQPGASIRPAATSAPRAASSRTRRAQPSDPRRPPGKHGPSAPPPAASSRTRRAQPSTAPRRAAKNAPRRSRGVQTDGPRSDGPRSDGPRSAARDGPPGA